MSEDALYAVEIRYDVRIPVRDGLQLSANLFMPVARGANERFPAILEMLPYRKDDWRHCSDHQRMSYFAQRGYIGCRLDIRGTGSTHPPCRTAPPQPGRSQRWGWSLSIVAPSVARTAAWIADR